MIPSSLNSLWARWQLLHCTKLIFFKPYVCLFYYVSDFLTAPCKKKKGKHYFWTLSVEGLFLTWFSQSSKQKQHLGSPFILKEPWSLFQAKKCMSPDTTPNDNYLMTTCPKQQQFNDRCNKKHWPIRTSTDPCGHWKVSSHWLFGNQRESSSIF